ncbi:MAG: Trp biosynthesis-associated membrane protein, partial [Actinomycetes bacterium]
LGTRGTARRVVGVLLLGLGVAVVAAGVSASGDPAHVREVASAAGGATVAGTGWPWLSHVGGVLLAASGLLVVLRGGAWPGLSIRYEVPAARSRDGRSPSRQEPGGPAPRTPEEPRAAAPGMPGESRPEDLWAALDRGEDPTAEQGPPGR